MITIQSRICRSLIALVIFGLGSGVAFSHDCSQEKTREAQRLWELAVIAKGGHDRLNQVSVLYVEDRPNTNLGSSTQYPFARGLYVFPDRAFMHMATDSLHQIVMMVSHGKFWSASNIPEFDVSPRLSEVGLTGEPDLEAATKFLMETFWVKSLPVCTWHDTVESIKVEVIETKVQGIRVLYYLDALTHLPIKIVYKYARAGLEDRPDHVILLSDYAVFDGIMMARWIHNPFEKRSNIPAARATYQFNVDYDPGVFERPPTRDMSGDAWRRKP